MTTSINIWFNVCFLRNHVIKFRASKIRYVIAICTQSLPYIIHILHIYYTNVIHYTYKVLNKNIFTCTQNVPVSVSCIKINLLRTFFNSLIVVLRKSMKLFILCLVKVCQRSYSQDRIQGLVWACRCYKNVVSVYINNTL